MFEGKKALHIDNNFGARSAVRAVLMSHGFEVVSLANLSDIDENMFNHVDITILDANFGELDDGIKLAKKLVGNGKKVLIYSMEKVPGSIPSVQKSADSQPLIDKITEVLGESE